MFPVDRREMGAAVAIGAMVSLIAAMAWWQQPSTEKPLRAAATFVSARPYTDTNKYRKPIARVAISVRLNDGSALVVYPAAECAPTYREGDRLELMGVYTNGGRVEWKIANARCQV